jgi:hypothetical protein
MERAKTDGIALGGQIAEKNRGATHHRCAPAKVAFTPKFGAGLYQLTPPLLLGDHGAMGHGHAVRAA